MFSPVAFIGIAIMSCVMSVAVLGSLLQARIPGLGRWCAAYVVLAVALSLLLVQRDAPPAIVTATVGVMLVFAALLVVQGFRQFFFLRPSFFPEYLLAGAVVSGFVYWTFAAVDLDARVSLLSAFLGYVRIAVGWMAYRFRPPGRPRYSYLFVAVSALAGAVIHVGRGLAYGFGFAHQTTFLEATPLNTAFLGMGILTLPCLSIGMVMLAHDRMAERMERMATIDELTGTLVRRAFLARGKTLLDATRASGKRLSIAILDIDNFKTINDRYGHAAGDRTLACFAAAISKGIRRTDLFGRLGGEEFGVLFADASKAEAAKLADQLRASIAVLMPQQDGRAKCTFSAGVAEFGDGDTFADAMARADAALYAAKDHGRNCVMAAPVANGDAGGACEVVGAEGDVLVQRLGPHAKAV